MKIEKWNMCALAHLKAPSRRHKQLVVNFLCVKSRVMILESEKELLNICIILQVRVT